MLEDEQPAFWAPIIGPLAAVTAGQPVEAFVRIMVLRRMCARADKVYWTREEILRDLSFVQEQRVISALARLRRHDIIRGASTVEHMKLIEVTAAGRAVLAALQAIKAFGNDEDLRFGYVVSQLAASTAAGNIQAEVIDVCLSAINRLAAQAEEALDLRSERLIEEASSRIERNWRWLEQAGEILQKLARDPDMPLPVHRKAQQTGQVLARAQRLDSVLKEHGAEIARQRERIGKSGLTVRAVIEWLRGLDAEALCAIGRETVCTVPAAILINERNAFEVGEACLIKDRSTAAPPPLPPRPAGDPSAEDAPPINGVDFLAFVNILRALDRDTTVESIALVAENFETTSLRMATLVRAEASSLATRKSAREPLFEAAQIELRWTAEPLVVGGTAVHRMSGGTVVPKNRGEKQ